MSSRRRRRRATPRRLAAALMLGVGTIFQTKRPDEHWSSSPKITIEIEASSEAAGDPPHRLDDLHPAFEPAPPLTGHRRRRRPWPRRRHR